MRGTLIAVATVAVLAGCSTYDSLTQRIAQSITPYRITVVQGNFVSREMADQMKVGMTRTQVRQLLGTPLLTDMFHADRWDYVFYFKRGSTAVVQQRDFVVFFSGDLVTHWTGGDDLPTNLELLAEIDGDRRGRRPHASPPSAASAAAAVAAASAASAPAAAAAPTADTTRSPSVEGAAAAGAPSTDANAEAAQAANRATNAVQTGTAPSVRSGVPTANAGGIPTQGPTAAGQPQFQFHRPPPPAPATQSNPVGPAGSQNSGDSTSNAPQTGSSSNSGTGD
ncbi:outer membrane protein assembly factor BamE domain-containing protein [Paraburkholderia susongensis]|uniref:Outer membrane protein assembly factor BamE n=1 Tax=Paraburkholderia susongensis TaxID=1515439 RepID=A0A1X7LUR7_9BURK|nr:outer membrane protein assembly factor BamE [Paraburkholderia susongensis]SMG57217.1 Beta-barrel assembly machine subunit BamE [Paraburkholderia susongensis]